MKAAWSSINKAVNGINSISSLLYTENEETGAVSDPEEDIANYTNSMLAKCTTIQLPNLLLYRINTLSNIAYELNESFAKLKDNIPSLRGNDWRNIDLGLQNISSEFIIDQTDVICSWFEASEFLIKYINAIKNNPPPDETLEKKLNEVTKAYNSLNNMTHSMKKNYEAELAKKNSAVQKLSESLSNCKSKLTLLENENKTLREEVESTKLTVSQVQKSLEISNDWNEQLTKRVSEMKEKLDENNVNKENYVDKRILIQMLKRSSESSNNPQSEEIIEILCNVLGIDINENKRSLTSEFLDFLDNEVEDESQASEDSGK